MLKDMGRKKPVNINKQTTKCTSCKKRIVVDYYTSEKVGNKVIVICDNCGKQFTLK